MQLLDDAQFGGVGLQLRWFTGAAARGRLPGEHEGHFVIEGAGDVGICLQEQAHLFVVSVAAEVEDEAVGRQVIALAQGGAFVGRGAGAEMAAGGDGDGADSRGGDLELFADIGGGGFGIGEQQIGAAGGRADQGDIEALR